LALSDKTSFILALPFWDHGFLVGNHSIEYSICSLSGTLGRAVEGPRKWGQMFFFKSPGEMNKGPNFIVIELAQTGRWPYVVALSKYSKGR